MVNGLKKPKGVRHQIWKPSSRYAVKMILLFCSDGTEKKSPNDQPVDIVERNSDSKKTETAEVILVLFINYS